MFKDLYYHQQNWVIHSDSAQNLVNEGTLFIREILYTQVGL